MAQIEFLQTQIEVLKAKVEENTASVQTAKAAAKEANEAAEVAVQSVEQGGGGNWTDSTTIGGYGELHYNNLDSGDSIDFHRFVLYFGHEFSDNLRFFSELELEHAFSGDGKPGEVELEQAYFEYDFNEYSTARAGVFLIPVGIMNGTHEPPTFYGVERNGVEKDIVPATWWEAGAGWSGHNDSGVSWDIALHSGLNSPVDGSNAFKIRSGRQKVAKAQADDLAFTGRLRYTGVTGLELAVTFQHQSDITQGNGIESASADLIEAHVTYENGPFNLRALYASWDVDSAAAAAIGRDKQEGYYIEPSWKFNESWGVFARMSEWNNEAGLSSSEDNEQFDIGVNWWLHPNVVIKADIQNQSGGKDKDGFNLGVGYQF